MRLLSLLLLPWVAARCGGEAGSSDDGGGFLPETDAGPDIDQIYRDYEDRCTAFQFIIGGLPDCGVIRHKGQVVPGTACGVTSRPSAIEMLNPRPEHLRLLEEIRGTNRCLVRVDWFARPFSGAGENIQCFALVEGTDTGEIRDVQPDPASSQPECEVRKVRG